VANALIKEGRVRRSWAGIEVQPTVGSAGRAGALVSWVASGSPAASAGLRAGDVLVKVNDAATNAQFAEQVPLVNQVLFGLRIGEPAVFTVLRDSRELAFKVAPLERPAALSIPRELRSWGFVASNLTAFEARNLGRSSTSGVRVVSVRNGGPMEQARPPLSRDDVIIEVEGTRITSVSELEAIGESGIGKKLLVTFERGREVRVTVVEPAGTRPPDAPPAEARKAWVPITVQVLTPPLAERLGLAGRTGVRVTQVFEPALPLKVGDVIVAVDGQAVRATAVNDEDVFAAAIRRAAIGSTTPLTVFRDGKEMTVAVPLAAAPPLTREMKRYEDAEFGFRARDLADADRRDPRLDGDTAGVIVDSVTNGSWASLGRLTSGDVIVSVDGRTIANVEDLAARFKDIRSTRPASVVVFVRRGVKSLFLDLQPSWQ
jgi:S1-C subfamily serine protease